jgi:hypothetical protein
MKLLLAAIAGTLLTASLISSPAVANDESDQYRNTDVRYWPAGRAIMVNDPDAPGGRVMLVAEPGMEPPQGGGGKAIYVSDDPRYDLSGSGDVLYLVEDGSTVKARAGRGVAVFAGTNAVPRDRVSIPAEYRQDWMAIAAGDRPVRVVSPGTVSSDMDMARMAYVPVRVFDPTSGSEYTRYRGNGTNGARYTTNGGTRYTKRSALKQRRHRATRPASTAHVASSKSYARKHHAANASYRPYRKARTSAYAPASYAPAVASDDRVAEETRPVPQPDLYQIGNSWYREENGVWTRGYSWKGPFVPIQKGRVPREVIQASKRHE